MQPKYHLEKVNVNVIAAVFLRPTSKTSSYWKAIDMSTADQLEWYSASASAHWPTDIRPTFYRCGLDDWLVPRQSTASSLHSSCSRRRRRTARYTRRRLVRRRQRRPWPTVQHTLRSWSWTRSVELQHIWHRTSWLESKGQGVSCVAMTARSMAQSVIYPGYARGTSSRMTACPDADADCMIVMPVTALKLRLRIHGS